MPAGRRFICHLCFRPFAPIGTRNPRRPHIRPGRGHQLKIAVADRNYLGQAGQALQLVQQPGPIAFHHQVHAPAAGQAGAQPVGRVHLGDVEDVEPWRQRGPAGTE